MENLRNKGREIVQNVRSIKSWSTVLALLLVMMISAIPVSAAAGHAGSATSLEAITRHSLAGKWAATIVGNTGCGASSIYVTFELNSAGSGSGTATVVMHGQCGDTTTGLDFDITSLDANGSGTASLSCDTNCGWATTIQVARNSQTFSLVDVCPANANNYIAGTAIKQ